MAIKSALKITGYVLGVVFISFIALIFLVDANSFKPRIEAAAKAQGIALAMGGDLQWAFWPALGLAVQDVSVASVDTPDKPIAKVKKASLLVAFMPLLHADVQVKHILVDTAAIDLQVDAQGVGNWTKLIKSTPAPAVPVAPTDTGSKELKLAIEKISLQHSQVTYSDLAKGSRFLLKNIDLEMDDVNLDGKAFTMAFSGEAVVSQAGDKTQPLSIKATLSQKLTLDKTLSEVKLSEGDVVLEVSKAASSKLKFKYSLKLGDLKNNLAYQGEFTSDTFSARELLAVVGVAPKTANPKALSEVKVTANINGDKAGAALSDLELKLDKTSFKGSLAITNFATSALEVKLQGDEINVDDYLAPKVVAPAAATSTAAALAPASVPVVTGDETLIPLEPLRKLNADISAGFKKMQVLELSLADVQLEIKAQDGNIHQQLSASAYSGNIREKASLRIGQSAQLQFETQLKGVEIAPILKDKKLDKSLHLSGAVQFNAQGQASGVTKNQLVKSLTGGADFAGAKVRLAPLNVEQQFCKVINLVNRVDDAEHSWPEYTELRELTGKVAIANRVITIESLNAAVEKLLLAASGNINLEKGSYDLVLPLKLVRDATDTPATSSTSASIATSANGCTVTSNYWAERSMSLLRCKGAYAAIDPKHDCRPDKDMLASLTKDYAEYKLKEKHGAKLEAKKEELIKKLDEKLGGEGKAEKAKDLLKNLLKKKDDK